MSNSSNHAVERLRQLENQSWECEAQKQLYSTPLVSGFPWFTVPSLEGKEGEDNQSGSRASARRHVVPYTYTFKVFAKGRWVGQPLLSVYSEELAHHRPAYYAACWQRGRLRCIKRQEKNEGAKHNLKRRDVKRAVAATTTTTTLTNCSGSSVEGLFVGVDTMASEPQPAPGVSAAPGVILEQGDVVLHTVHRHEVPLLLGTSGVEALQLLAAPIVSCGLLVLHKPAGVPTHPTGRYYYNSVLMMLEYVLTPKRLHAWLWEEDPLLQSLVCTSQLSEKDKHELQAYYNGGEEEAEREAVDAEKAPRPCYRLDKATSGVLLLGVHQEATAHVARVLMEKSKSVDSAVQSTLQALSLSANSETNLLHDFAEALVGTNFGVRKRYLAKVQGNFPATLQHLLVHMETMRKDTAPAFLLPVPLSAAQMQTLLQHSRVEDLVKEMSCTSTCSATVATATTTTAAAGIDVMYPRGVMIASPVEDVQSHATKKANDNSNNHTNSINMTTNAVTIVQCLFVSSKEGKAESLLLCVPLTGRQNQIRLHCKDWLCPIVQDPLRFKPSALFHHLGSAPLAGHHHCTTNHNDDNDNVVATLYFKEEELPPAFYQNEFPEEFKHYKDKLAALRSSAATNDATIADELACESVCYECSGELPVATLSAAEGTSAICLHAWEYEMDAPLLYTSNRTPVPSEDASGHAVQAKKNKMEENKKKKKKKAQTEVEDESSVAVAADVDGTGAKNAVVFRALPLPTWV